MTERKFTSTAGVLPCPKCGNTHSFVAVSQQVMEDGCEMWIRCGACGNEPGWMDRREDVWGCLDDASIRCLVGDWNEWTQAEATVSAGPH
jgi:hypothetical protein